MNLQTLLKYKTTIIIIAVVITLAVICIVVFKHTGLGDKINEKIAMHKLGETLDEEISTGSVTITPATAAIYASQLYSAMDGIGTDEDAIYEVFVKLATRSDVLFLIKTFGAKDGRTLPEWIVSELNSSERTKLNNILSNNNINYQF